MTRRLAGPSLAAVNKAMLNDRDLLAQLGAGVTGPGQSVARNSLKQ
jgi:hypothetical protein